MEYLALIYADEGAWESLQEDERTSIYNRYMAFSARRAREAGVLVAGDELAGTADATTVRVRDAQIAVTDCPARGGEGSAGRLLPALECASMDEAVDWGGPHPRCRAPRRSRSAPCPRRPAGGLSQCATRCSSTRTSPTGPTSRR